MKPKSARHWLARNKWKMAKTLAFNGTKSPKFLWFRYWLCLSITEVLFRRFSSKV